MRLAERGGRGLADEPRARSRLYTLGQDSWRRHGRKRTYLARRCISTGSFFAFSRSAPKRSGTANIKPRRGISPTRPKFQAKRAITMNDLPPVLFSVNAVLLCSLIAFILYITYWLVKRTRQKINNTSNNSMKVIWKGATWTYLAFIIPAICFLIFAITHFAITHRPFDPTIRI